MSPLILLRRDVVPRRIADAFLLHAVERIVPNQVAVDGFAKDAPALAEHLVGGRWRDWLALELTLAEPTDELPRVQRRDLVDWPSVTKALPQDLERALVLPAACAP